MIISNNLISLNAQHNYKINTDNKAKATKKLSSGYRINSAADDAANLTISEKMREQIRGLDKGTQNAQDGVSWIQTGEGALQDVQNILHRMSELTIQSLNDTNTNEDRAALQQEFDALQSEIDRISQTTQFNTKDIFEQHEPNYYQVEGNAIWQQSQPQMVTIPDNTLTIEYRKEEGGPVDTITIEIPEGMYTTQELVDEFDDALRNGAGYEEGIRLEYTKDGTCNLNIEGGDKIENVSGGLSYLLFDMYEGGSTGALIGTTIFKTDYDKLKIKSGQNDNMSFQIQYFDGSKSNKNITVPEGSYTRDQLIDLLNGSLSGTKVEAVKYGTGIKLQSDEAIIDGFKGNMFKIDVAPDPIYTSIFYDNVMYGKTTTSAAEFTGGAVLPSSSQDEKFNKYVIDSSNNTLKMAANNGTQVDLTIPDGKYTVAQMADKLNELFAANGMNLTASRYTSGSFEGMKLISNEKGLNSNIDIDNTSSAYNTLFKNKDYTSYGSKVYPQSDSKSDSVPTFTSGKTFNADTLPLTITSWVNDKFELDISGTKYTISLDAGVYNDANSIASMINGKLNGSGAGAGYKGKVIASNQSGKIVLSGVASSGLSTFNVSAVAGNNGFSDLFVGENVRYIASQASGNGTPTSPAVLTTNTPISFPATVDSSNNKFTVNIDGVNRNVTLPTGSNSKDDIVNSINSQLQEIITTSDNKFTSFNERGTTKQNTVTLIGQGSTNHTNKTFSGNGISTELQGSTGFDKNIPATKSIDKPLNSTTTIDSTNNTFTISVNGVEKTVTLSAGNYSRSAFVSELQNKLDAEYGKYYGGVIVGLNSDNTLSFTSRLNEVGGGTGDGGETSISINTMKGTFLKELYTTRSQAKATSTRALGNSITVDDTSNKFNFTYTDGSGNKSVSLTLANGTYNQSSIVSEINNQLVANGIAVTASMDSSKNLVLTSNNAGQEYKIQYNSSSGGSSSKILFGNLVDETPATRTTNMDIQPSITIDDSSNTFNINVNGTMHNIVLDNGTYTRQGLVDQLNQKLQADGANMRVELSGNKLKYTTNNVGSSASLKMDYESGGTAMQAIYGTSTAKTPGATASFDGAGKLVLTSKDNNAKMKMESGSGGLFQKSDMVTDTVNPTKKDGYISNTKSYIKGYAISSPVSIDNYNDVMNFKYSANGTNYNVSVSLPQQQYTYDELKDKLQSQIDAVAGAGELKVTVDPSGIKIECEKPGNKYTLSDFSGDFYDKLMCKSGEVHQVVNPSSKAGGQYVQSAFAVGRQDIKNGTVEIQKDLNDEFEFDFTYPGSGSPTTFSLKLSPGIYTGNNIVNELQKKLNEQLVDKGFESGLIEVGIGGVSTGVAGANDSSALCLKLSNSVPCPGEGTYIIDGVKGSAAFYTFYQSDGKLVPAYIKGSKDVSNGVTIDDTCNELSLTVDGTDYTIQLDNGDYNADELQDMITAKLNDASIPVKAKLDGKNLKLEYNEYGKHSISNLAGSARQNLFYQENKGDGLDKNINVQLSSNAGVAVTDDAGDGKVVGRDSMQIQKDIVNTVFLGINSVTISKRKYAEKAISRLQEALEKVSSVRTDFGATQNRLEHAMASNANASENTSRAESLRRDADMADEMVAYSRSSILQQVGESVIAQANSIPEGVLRLLQ